MAASVSRSFGTKASTSRIASRMSSEPERASRFSKQPLIVPRRCLSESSVRSSRTIDQRRAADAERHHRRRQRAERGAAREGIRDPEIAIEREPAGKREADAPQTEPHPAVAPLRPRGAAARTSGALARHHAFGHLGREHGRRRRRRRGVPAVARLLPDARPHRGRVSLIAAGLRSGIRAPDRD